LRRENIKCLLCRHTSAGQYHQTSSQWKWKKRISGESFHSIMSDRNHFSRWTNSIVFCWVQICPLPAAKGDRRAD
jgi:hypothetical protein